MGKLYRASVMMRKVWIYFLMVTTHARIQRCTG